MLIQSKRTLLISFFVIICLILDSIFYTQIHPESGNKPLEFIYFLALQGDKEAQFTLAKRIEDAARNDINLSVQQTLPKKLLDFTYQFVFIHQINHENAFDQFFQPIYSSQSEALKWYKTSAEQGHAAAQEILAEYYYNDGRGPQFKQAFHWVSKLAPKGDAFAQSQLGWMYFSGLGVEQNYKLAHQWFLKAGLQGNRSAAAYLAWMYLHAQGVQGNNAEAFKWYEMAAQYGDEEAQMMTIAMYTLGVGTEKNIEKSEFWKNKVKQATNRDFDYYYERNDYEKRLLYLAETNDKNKDQYLSNEYSQKYNQALKYKNERNGDLQRAFEIFNDLLTRNDPSVQYQLAEMYQKGIGTERNINKALELYKMAAAQNYILALLRLGDLYFEGNQDLAQDYAQALFWYQKIEALGQQHANMRLGEIYMNGLGVNKNPEKAFQYYLYLAEQGSQEAIKIVIYCYESGIGTTKNLKKAQEMKAKLRI